MFKTIAICFCILGICNLNKAQQAIATSGGESLGAGGTVSYTVGQVAWSNFSTNEGTINQGVQQTYEITVMPTGENVRRIYLELAAFPNPTSDFLLLKVKDYTPGNLSYQLYDINGQLLESKKLESVETIIPMHELARTEYFLRVLDNGTEVRTFKIVKN